MLVRASDVEPRTIENCHGGSGRLASTAFDLAAHECRGMKFLHDDVVEPNATIGEHTHADDEEVYYVLEGRGTIILDGERFDIGPGDLAVTPAGHSHGLINGPSPMRLIVACARC